MPIGKSYSTCHRSCNSPHVVVCATAKIDRFFWRTVCRAMFVGARIAMQLDRLRHAAQPIRSKVHRHCKADDVLPISPAYLDCNREPYIVFFQSSAWGHTQRCGLGWPGHFILWL